MTSVCQKKHKNLLWVLPSGARRSKPEIQQIQVSSHLPQTGVGTGSERKQPPWTLTPTPTFTKNKRTRVKHRPKGGLRTQGRGQERPPTWHHCEENKDIAKKTTLGFGEKRFYEKLSRKKKSRNCIELRKWRYVYHPCDATCITQFFGPAGTPPKGQCVVLNFASSKKGCAMYTLT